MRESKEGYCFDFPKASSIIKFDGKQHGMSHAMKAVDVVIELPDIRIYVEVKSPESHSEWAQPSICDKDNKRQDTLSALCNDLVYKYRDSFLYYWCQKAEEKKSLFVCLIDWSSPRINTLKQRVKPRFPSRDQQGGWPATWKRSFVDHIAIVNESLWNQNPTLSSLGEIRRETQQENK